jgi:hypothetical protein
VNRYIINRLSIKVILAAITVLMVVSAIAQKSQPLRVEIEAKKGSDNYNIVPLGAAGLIMFYESDERSNGKKMWEFSKYNTNLKEEWTKEVPIPPSSSLVKFYVDEKSSTLYVLLGYLKHNGSTTYNNASDVSGSFQIVNMNTETGANTTTLGKFPSSLSVTDFMVINNKASIMGLTDPGSTVACLQSCLTFTCIPAITGLTLYKYKSEIINVDLENGKSNVIPVRYKGNTLILSSNIVDDNPPYIKAFVRNKPKAKMLTQYINDYSANGELIKTTILNPTIGKMISSAKYEKISDNEAVMIGTYDNQYIAGWVLNPASSDATGMTTNSEGIYFSKFTGGQQDTMEFYPFSKLQNFLSYMDPGDVKQAIKRKNRAEKRGEELDVNYNILTHNIIKRNNEYILIGEAYYPEFQTQCYTTYASNGFPIQHCTTVFVGYRYTHAIIADFNKDGELLWDNCFPIQDILTFNLKERVKVMTSDNDNEIVLAYSYGGSIKSQIIEGDKVVQGKEENKIETAYANDQVKEDWSSDMDLWYDNYFLTWGYEKIKNEEANKGKRTVFYFNKIGLE